MHPGYGAQDHYQIVREKTFQEKMETLIRDYRRLAEFETALVTEDLDEYDLPSLRILYLIEPGPKRVLLLDVDLAE